MHSAHSTVLAALFATTSLASPGFSQTSTETANASVAADDGEIIVTAQKRSESLQNVPISIQVLGTQKLDQLNVGNFNDYTKLLPSVTFQTTQPGQTTVYFRGVASGGDGNHSGSLPSVGVYLDEQPVSTIGGTLDVHVYDIARIEALAGPQGTLYGASSEAGTIRIITNKPETSGLSAAVDSEVNTVKSGGIGGKLEGFINVPLGERIALRVVGWYQHDAGYIDNVLGTRTFLPAADGSFITKNNAADVKKNYNDVDIVGGRAALKIDLDDNWTIEPTVLAQKQTNHGSFGYDPSVGDLKVQHFGDEFNKDKFIQAALTVTGKVGNFDLTYAGAYFDRRRHTSSDYTDYAEQYDSLYSGVGGLAQYFYFNDAAGNLIDPSQHIVASDHFTKNSQELRLASPTGKRFRVVGGLFYQRQTNLIHQDYQVTGLAPNLSVNGFPGTLWLTQQKRVDRDYAAFGEASLDILSNLTLTGGLRYFKYDNSLIGFFGFGRDPDGPPYNAAGSSRTGVAACFTDNGQSVRDNPTGTVLPAAVAGGPCTNLGIFNNGSITPKRTKDDGVTHRLNLTWKIDSDHLLYATWSRGFRPGGINRRADIEPYAADFLSNYELGFKTSWFDRALRINGAFFWQDWKAFQYSFLGVNSFTEVHNGPNARIKGVEADINWSAAPGLVLTASGAYTDAKTRKNLCAFDDPTFACTAPGPGGETSFISSPMGTRLPITPKLKANLTARYEMPLGDTVKGHIQAVVAHQGSASSDLRELIIQPGTGDPVNPAAGTGRLKAYTTADFAIGAVFPFVSAEIFIQNAFDTRAQLSRFQECGQCFQRPYIVTNTPRTIGVRLGHKF